MKHIVVLTTMALFLSAVGVFAQDKPKDQTKTQEASIDLEEMTCQIRGMTCGGCVQAVETTLSKIDGVERYEVSLEKGEAKIEYNPNKVTANQIQKELQTTPFTITEKKGSKPKGDK